MSAETDKRLQCAASEASTSAMSSRDWQVRYDEGKTGWDRGQPSPMLLGWLTSGQLQPCKILVPGCGRGHEVIELAQRGFDVTAIDFADAAVQWLSAQLQNRNLTAQVLQSDILSYCRQQRFDAVYEQTCLCALHPSQWERYVQLLGTWLRPGGNLFALFMQTNSSPGPPFHCDMARMQQLFDGSQWHWDSHSEHIEHPTGLHEVACVLTRKASSN